MAALGDPGHRERRRSHIPRLDNPVDAHRRSNVLERGRRQLEQRKGELVLDLVVDLLGQADSAGVGEGLDSGGDVYGVPQDIVAGLHHVPNVEADANADSPLIG